MPRPTDIASKATTESRRKGAIAANKVRREQGKSIRQRISDKLDEEADLVVQVYVDAMKAKRGKDADHPTRLKAVNDAIEQAHGKPAQAVELSGPEGEPMEVNLSDDTAQRVLAGLVSRGLLRPGAAPAADPESQ